MMLRLLIVIAAALGASAAWAGEAGKIIFTAGQAQIAGRPAQLDATVSEGDLLSTGADGYLYMKTVDDGLFILRPSSRARIAVYHVDALNPANTQVKLELLNGVARSQSGHAVKLARQNFRFNTPVAAIGVRGTDFTVFTDQDTSRVAVLSGGIVVSGFGGACRPEGSGPCGGNASSELSATQKGQLLEVRRGRGAPLLLQGSMLGPDQIVPPRSDEPIGAKDGSGEAHLDAKKDSTIKHQVLPLESLTPVTPVTPPVVDVPVPPVEPPVQREVSWGRWQAVSGQAATSTLAKAGAERVGMNEMFALFRSTTGEPYVAPERGSVGFALQSGQAYVRETGVAARSAASVENGQLLVDFGNASYTTSIDVVQGADRYKMASKGSVARDGVFNGTNQYANTNNMTVTGVLDANGGATYLFEGNLTPRKVVSGVAVWGK